MHQQRTENSCGPDCLGTISKRFGISQQQVDEAFNCPDISEFSNLQDTPANHISAMRKLGIKYRTVTADQICAGECQDGRVIVLLHSKDDPETIVPEGILIQHWAIVTKVLGNCLYLDMGLPSLDEKLMSFPAFKARYEGCPTKTAWEITGLGEPMRPKWWVRLWCWLVGKK